MLERLTGLFRASSTDVYVQRVTTALVRDGLQLGELDNFKAMPEVDESGRVFELLQEKKLSPVEGADALRLAVNLFRKTRYMAETIGWPLHAMPATGVTRMEAYFLELLAEAARSVQFRT